MRWSRLHIPTLREAPAGASTPAHQLLLRAGYLRPHSPGVFAHLPLARLTFARLRQLILHSFHAQEVLLPGGLTPASLAELRSYKQLPQSWAAFTSRQLDDSHPASGVHLLRHYSTATIWTLGAPPTPAVTSLFAALELDVLSLDGRLVVLSSSGDTPALRHTATGRAEPLPTARTTPAPPALPDPPGDLTPEPFHTPGQKSIADVSRFTALPETSQIKSLVLVAGAKPYLVLLRGDHQLSEPKFLLATGAPSVRPAFPHEIEEWFGASPGSLGPLGVTAMPILADAALAGRRNMICGANRDDYHLRHVTPGRDFTPAFHDLRLPAPNDSGDAAAPVEVLNTLEIGRLFSPGIPFHVLDAAGRQSPAPIHACTLGLDRLLTALAEHHHDANGLALPPAAAPFGLVITPVSPSDPACADAAESLYNAALAANRNPLLDDRDERPGVKFKDADLTGIPFRLTIGKKLPEGLIELYVRRTRESRDVPLAAALDSIPTP